MKSRYVLPCLLNRSHDIAERRDVWRSDVIAQDINKRMTQTVRYQNYLSAFSQSNLFIFLEGIIIANTCQSNPALLNVTLWWHTSSFSTLVFFDGYISSNGCQVFSYLLVKIKVIKKHCVENQSLNKNLSKISTFRKPWRESAVKIM